MPYTEGNWSPAVEAARQRRAASASTRIARTEWFIKQVSEKIHLTIRQRVRLATEFLKDHIIRNVSVPVEKLVTRRQVVNPDTGKKKWVTRIRVTKRSKPGEYPRADTTQLMKTVFSDYGEHGNTFEGYVGTPLDYAVILELYMQRGFMVRTLDEHRDEITRILSGPLK